MALRFLILAVLVSACSRTVPQVPTAEPLAAAARNHLVVVESDYKTGLLEVLDLVAPDKSTHYPIHSDAVARAPQGSQSVFVLNRYLQDSILVLGSDGLTKKSNYSVGVESNPQDIVWINESKALVSRYQSPDLLVVNPQTGQALSTISLAGLADDDGVPEMAWMAKDGNNIAVALQRLSKILPTEKSKLAIIDATTLAVSEKTLTKTNPTTELKQGPSGDWYVGEAEWTGLIAKIDGGIERLEKGTFEPRGIIVEEKELGGEVVDFEILTEQSGVAIVAIAAKKMGEMPVTQLLSFNPTTGKLLARLDSDDAPLKYLHQLLVDRPRGIFYVADREPQAYSIRVFSMSTLKEIPEAKRALKMPPYHVSWMD